MRSAMLRRNELDVNNNAIDYYNTPRTGAGTRQDSWLPDMTALDNVYSQDLVALVESCLCVDPAGRPAPRALLGDIRRLAQFNGADTTQLVWNDKRALGRLGLQDAYREGMAVPT